MSGRNLRSTSSSEARPAKRSASRGSAKGSQTPEATLLSSTSAWLIVTGLGTWSGKTSPVSLARLEDGTLVPSSGGFQNSGTGGPTGSSTLSTSEWNRTLVPSHSDGGVCSLSDALEETGSVPQKYYLSQKACAGILRRAEKRGKRLPAQLREALEAASK